MSLSLDEKQQLLSLSRDVLIEWVQAETRLDVSETPFPACLKENQGAFVTLTIKEQLRGCIGYIEGIMPLYEAVIENTINAASKDPRFPEVRSEELDQIRIEISVMSVPVKMNSIEEIEVGRHGLIVSRHFFKGLLLPQVAVELDWDRDTFLAHTCMKAGLASDAWTQPKTKVQLFDAQVFNESDLNKM